MDRINLKCLIAGRKVELQLDKKAMPGEAGPCFMITKEGCFQGYIACQKDGSYNFLGAPHFPREDLQLITEQLTRNAQ